jgi:hypothetical protein
MSASRWACGLRTQTEIAVMRGTITRAAGESYLRKLGVPMTAPSRVFKGEPPAAPIQGSLV